jgi:hypothetical protein
VPIVALLIASLSMACGGVGPTDPPGQSMSIPQGWRTVDLPAVSFAVPGDAQAAAVQPIDSVVGILRGAGYELIYDYGRAGESLTDNRQEPEFAMRERTIDGRPAVEVSFASTGQPWGFVRLLQVQDRASSLTVRVSCVDRQTCQLATAVFDSVKFSGR